MQPDLNSTSLSNSPHLGNSSYAEYARNSAVSREILKPEEEKSKKGKSKGKEKVQEVVPNGDVNQASFREDPRVSNQFQIYNYRRIKPKNMSLKTEKSSRSNILSSKQKNFLIKIIQDTVIEKPKIFFPILTPLAFEDCIKNNFMIIQEKLKTIENKYPTISRTQKFANLLIEWKVMVRHGNEMLLEDKSVFLPLHKKLELFTFATSIQELNRIKLGNQIFQIAVGGEENAIKFKTSLNELTSKRIKNRLISHQKYWIKPLKNPDDKPFSRPIFSDIQLNNFGSILVENIVENQDKKNQSKEFLYFKPTKEFLCYEPTEDEQTSRKELVDLICKGFFGKEISPKAIDKQISELNKIKDEGGKIPKKGKIKRDEILAKKEKVLLYLAIRALSQEVIDNSLLVTQKLRGLTDIHVKYAGNSHEVKLQTPKKKKCLAIFAKKSSNYKTILCIPVDLMVGKQTVFGTLWVKIKRYIRQQEQDFSETILSISNLSFKSTAQFNEKHKRVIEEVQNETIKQLSIHRIFETDEEERTDLEPVLEEGGTDSEEDLEEGGTEMWNGIRTKSSTSNPPTAHPKKDDTDTEIYYSTDKGHCQSCFS